MAIKMHMEHLSHLERLLLECEDVALTRGDIYGLMDCIDNHGHPYQSQELANVLKVIRAKACTQNGESTDGGPR